MGGQSGDTRPPERIWRALAASGIVVRMSGRWSEAHAAEADASEAERRIDGDLRGPPEVSGTQPAELVAHAARGRGHSSERGDVVGSSKSATCRSSARAAVRALYLCLRGNFNPSPQRASAHATCNNQDIGGGAAGRPLVPPIFFGREGIDERIR